MRGQSARGDKRSLSLYGFRATHTWANPYRGLTELPRPLSDDSVGPH